MLARILYDGGVYTSPVFAVSIKRSGIKAVVFDDSFSALTVVEMYQGNQYNLFFMNCNTDGFSIREKKLKSYWNNRRIFRAVKKGAYTPQMLQDAKNILKETKIEDFTVIQSPADLEALNFTAGNFHDAYILGMMEKDGVLEILFDTSWGSFILLRCKGVTVNELEKVESMFFHCEMHTDTNGTTLCFDGCKTLKAEQMAFRPLVERRMPLHTFTYSFENGQLTIQESAAHQSMAIPCEEQGILDLAKRKVLGYFTSSDEEHHCILFTKDIAYSFREFFWNNRRAKGMAEKGEKFRADCEFHGFYFDKMPFDFDG
jgi:hypothetical protein